MGQSNSAPVQLYNRTRRSQQAVSEEDWPFVRAIREPDYLDWKQSCGVESINDIAKAQCNHPVEIGSRLYLSDAKGVHSPDRLQELGVTHVLNVAGKAATLNPELHEKMGINVLNISAEDEEGYPMLSRHLAEARSFVDQAKKAKGTVVVHCVAGLNRSGVIIAAIHMLEERKSVLETVAHCRKARGNLFLCNESFQEQLVSLARSEDLLGEKPSFK